MPLRGPPTKSEQLDYLLQWFLEYSDVQKDDFLLILINQFAPSKDEDLLPDALKLLNTTDLPPSIFQCRMKLFNDWFSGWNEEEKTDLLRRLTDIDDDFIQKFNEAIDHQEPNNHYDYDDSQSPDRESEPADLETQELVDEIEDEIVEEELSPLESPEIQSPIPIET